MRTKRYGILLEEDGHEPRQLDAILGRLTLTEARWRVRRDVEQSLRRGYLLRSTNVAARDVFRRYCLETRQPCVEVLSRDRRYAVSLWGFGYFPSQDVVKWCDARGIRSRRSRERVGSKKHLRIFIPEVATKTKDALLTLIGKEASELASVAHVHDQ